MHREDYEAAGKKVSAWTHAHTAVTVGIIAYVAGFVTKWAGWIF